MLPAVELIGILVLSAVEMLPDSCTTYIQWGRVLTPVLPAMEAYLQ